MSGKAKYKTNDHFFAEWNSNMAYILGFITADGSVRKYTLAIELSVLDVEVLKYIRKKISPTRPLEYIESKKSVRLRINSKTLVQDLAKLGIIPRKSKTIRMPMVPKEYLSDYVRGVFDGDGWVHLRRNSIETGIVSGSKKFLQDLQNNLPFIGGDLRKRTNVTKTGKKSIYYLWEMCKADSLQLRDLMYDSNGFALKRKKTLMYSQFYQKSTRYWTPEQINYLTQNFKPNTKGLLIQLSKTIGKTYKSVSKKIWELGLTEPHQQS